jgi:hypothetical protein
MKRSPEERHTQTHRSLIETFLVITDVFFYQKRINVGMYVQLLSSDQERHLWLWKCFNYASMCLCVPFVWRSLHFLVRVSSFLSGFLYYPYFGTFFSACSMIINYFTHPFYWVIKFKVLIHSSLLCSRNEENPSVYNVTAFEKWKISVKSLYEYMIVFGLKMPMPGFLWIPRIFITDSRLIFKLHSIIIQLIPALIIDFFIKLSGRKPMQVFTYRTFSKGSSLSI